LQVDYPAPPRPCQSGPTTDSRPQGEWLNAEIGRRARVVGVRRAPVTGWRLAGRAAASMIRAMQWEVTAARRAATAAVLRPPARVEAGTLTLRPCTTSIRLTL
jgi:hypothetical protein